MKNARNYRGFTITAIVEQGAGGFIPYVTLAREGGKTETARRFDVPAARPFETEDDATRRAIDYGMDLAEGAVKGFDPNRVN